MTGTITLTSGEIQITDSLTISGPGSGALTISGNNSSRIFKATGTLDLDVDGLHLTRGRTTGSWSNGVGSAVATFHTGSFTLTDSLLDFNAASHGGAALGLYNTGNITIDNTVISNNTSAELAGGVYVGWGNNGAIVVSNTVISDNTQAQKGAWYSGAGASVEFRNCNVTGNISTGSLNDTGAGGIYAGRFGQTRMPMKVLNTTIANNSSQQTGGAYLSGNIDLVVANSTFTGNSGGTQGGGLQLQANTGGQFVVAQTTITGNSASVGSGVAVHQVGNGTAAVAHFYGSIVDGNTGSSSQIEEAVTSTPASRVPAVAARNSALGSIQGSLVFTDNGGNLRNLGTSGLKLGSLANNGGPTNTMLPLTGSPLINAGGATVPTFPGNQFDQRGSGYLRLVDAILDIGAVEVQAAPPPPPPDPEVPVVPVFTG